MKEMMHAMNTMSRYCYKPELGLLLIRVVAGFFFIHHGLMKLQNIAGMSGFFASLGLPLFMLYFVAIVEFVGGIMLVFGVLTRAAGVALGCVALFAAVLAVLPHKGIFGAELELLLAAVSFGLALIGSGSYRLMHIFEHDKEK